MDKLQPLLAFLQHQPYGSEPETWKRAVQVGGCSGRGLGVCST